MEAFSDGVFSVVITLLVLDLKVPHLDPASTGRLFGALFEEWPTYVAFCLTFASVLVMWINHHGIFKEVRKTSNQLFLSNGLLLLLVTTTPFTTALVTRYYRTPAASAAAAVYCGSFVLISVAFNWLWSAASACCRGTEHLRRVTRNYRIGFPIYCAATAAAFVHPALALGICTALWAFWLQTMRDA